MNTTMVDWKQIRNEFPVCEKYIYLNAAGGSPVSRSAADAGRQFYTEMLEFGDTFYEKWLGRAESTRKKVADYMGASEKEIAFTTNTSHGMNLVAQMLTGKGDVITMQDEFPSTTYPWLNQGVHVQMVSPVDGRYPLDVIEKKLTPKTKILVTSYVQYNTGFRQDLEALGKFCRERDLIFVVNATQALPVFPVDVKKMNIDFLVFTGLKWATAGYGIGCLYVSEKFLRTEKMPFAGWQSVHEPEQMDNMKLDLRHEASMLEGGCPHFPNIFALGGALDLFNRIGKENAAQRVLQLNRLLAGKLQQKGFELASPTDEKHMSGITIVKVKNPEETVEKLRKKNIIVSARGEGLRISVSVFNGEVDVEGVVVALKTD